MIRSSMGDMITPRTVIKAPQTSPTPIAVWTVWKVRSSFFAPMKRATITPAPLENPQKKPTRRKVRAPVELTAARASGPR